MIAPCGQWANQAYANPCLACKGKSDGECPCCKSGKGKHRDAPNPAFNGKPKSWD